MRLRNVLTVWLTAAPIVSGWTLSQHQQRVRPASSSAPVLLVNPNRQRGTTATTTSSLSAAATTASSSPSWFTTSPDNNNNSNTRSLDQRKAELLQLGAALDRGQAYNPTSGEYYASSMQAACQRLDQLVEEYPNNVPVTMREMAGEWELVLTTVQHGIFRSSPFFLAVQEAFSFAQDETAFGQDKAELFFKLHELQTCSWGASKIGRVAQTVTDTYLYSEFDTSLFSLTVIPIVGWFKLLPTFGGCVVTAAKAELKEHGLLEMQVDYTTARKVPGLQGLGSWTWDIQVPVNTIWKLLPWNKGRDATCKLYVRYCDDDFRIVQDTSGEYFVYTRPVLPRPLDLAVEELQSMQQQQQ